MDGYKNNNFKIVNRAKSMLKTEHGD